MFHQCRIELMLLPHSINKRGVLPRGSMQAKENPAIETPSTTEPDRVLFPFRRASKPFSDNESADIWLVAYSHIHASSEKFHARVPEPAPSTWKLLGIFVCWFEDSQCGDLFFVAKDDDNRYVLQSVPHVVGRDPSKSKRVEYLVSSGGVTRNRIEAVGGKVLEANWERYIQKGMFRADRWCLDTMKSLQETYAGCLDDRDRILAELVLSQGTIDYLSSGAVAMTEVKQFRSLGDRLKARIVRIQQWLRCNAADDEKMIEEWRTKRLK